MPTFNSCTKFVFQIGHGYGGIDDLTTERSFDSQATWVITMIVIYFVTCYPWVFVQLGNGRRPADRNWMSVLYPLVLVGAEVDIGAGKLAYHSSSLPYMF